MNEKTPLQIEEIEKETRAFECPNCHMHWQFRVRVNVTGVGRTLTGEEFAARENNQPIAPRFTSGAQQILDEAEATGILPAFKSVFTSGANANQIPNDLEAYFLTWLTKAQRKPAPQFGIRLCLPKEDRVGNLELYTFQQVTAVLSDGFFRAFLPTPLVKGETIKPLVRTNGMLHSGDTVNLEMWVRTKYGYVSHRGALFAEMQRKCVGEFDTANRKATGL